MNPQLVVEYYSDILCVWAWIAQRRIEELVTQFGEQIELRYHYVDIFGDVPSKMDSQWADRGGYAGFADHVLHSAEKFEQAPVNPEIWHSVRPATSGNAHLVLKAIEIAHGKMRGIEMALKIRRAFFVDAQDVSNLDLLFELVTAEGLDDEQIHRSVHNGAAMAALMGDYQQARLQGVKGSPSYLMDGGRQTLYGNVGYRVLHANIEELLRHPADEASWC